MLSIYDYEIQFSFKIRALEQAGVHTIRGNTEREVLESSVVIHFTELNKKPIFC